jgi:hypothetical protein
MDRDRDAFTDGDTLPTGFGLDVEKFYQPISNATTTAGRGHKRALARWRLPHTVAVRIFLGLYDGLPILSRGGSGSKRSLPGRSLR